MTQLNPFVLLCYFAAAAGISMFSMNPVIQALSLLGALSFFFVRNAGKKTGMHLPLCLMALLAALLNPLFTHNGATVLFILNGNPVTAEACFYGAITAIMLLATLYWFRSFSELMTSDKILYLFGRISPKLALLLSMAMRYIPLFGLQLKKTAQAQKAMGYFKEDNAPDRIKGYIRVFSVTVTWALETGILTADSMESRGYGEGRRSSFAIFRFYRKDGLFLALIGMLFLITVYGIATKAVAFQYYPTVLAHEYSAVAVLTYGAYSMLTFLPTAAEAGEKIKWKYLQSKISFRYPMNQAPTLRNLSFSVEEGEFLTVCGATGSGKSTLLRLLKKELSPVGETEGEILLDGAPLASKSAASEIGYVMQHPEQQIVTDKVWHELAFGLENQNLPQNEIRRRVAEMASYFGMEELFFRDTVSLSGGQKQLLNLASVMVMNPKILLLDEPTAQLDPIAASDFIATLHKLHREFSLTVILIEHRLEEVMPLSDRLLILEKGELLALEPPREAVKKIENRADLLRAMPCAVRLSHALPDHGSKYAPMTVREGKDFIREVYNNKIRSIPEQPFSKKEKALEWDRVFFRYEKNGRDVLSNLRFSVFEGECFCVLGGNGAGKSTMLGVTAGLLKPYAGTVRLFGKKLKEYVNGSLYRQNLAYLPQDVTTVFLRNTVREELEDAGTSAADFPYDFSPLLEKHPYDLSGGERQLVALAKILATRPKVLLLDEPTKGLDAHAKAEIVSVLRALKEKNVTVIAVTHDTEFSAELADRVALFFRGELISSDTPRKFFSENRFYTTPVSRMTTGYYENAVTVADAVSLCLENGRKERKT